MLIEVKEIVPGWWRYSLDSSLNLIIGCWLRKSNSQINNRNINSGNTEGHSSQLSVKLWEHLANSLQEIKQLQLNGNPSYILLY